MKEICEFTLLSLTGLEHLQSPEFLLVHEEGSFQCSAGLTEIPRSGSLLFQVIDQGEILFCHSIALDDIRASTDVVVHINEKAKAELGFRITECLSTVPEEDTDMSILYDTDSLVQELADKNKALREKVLDLEQKISHLKWNHAQQIRHLKHVQHEEIAMTALLVDKLKFQVTSYQVIKDDLQNQLRMLEHSLKEEQIRTENLNSELKNLTTTHRKKEDDLAHSLTTKDKEIKDLKTSVVSLEAEIRSLNLDNSSLRDKVLLSDAHREQYEFLLAKYDESEKHRKILYDRLEESRIHHDMNIENLIQDSQNETAIQEEIKFLRNELEEARQYIVTLENKLEEKQLEQFTQHSSKIDDLKRQYAAYQQESKLKVNALNDQLRNLTSKLESAKKDNISLNSKLKDSAKTQKDKERALNQALKEKQGLQEELKHSKLKEDKLREMINRKEHAKQNTQNADERFKEYLRTYGIENEFVRVAEGVYTFGSKKVSVTIKNGCLVCRIGGGYMMIDEFLDLFLKTKQGTVLDEEIPSEDDDLMKENYNKYRVPMNTFKNFKPVRQTRDWATYTLRKK